VHALGSWSRRSIGGGRKRRRKKNHNASLLLTDPLQNGFKGELGADATTGLDTDHIRIFCRDPLWYLCCGRSGHVSSHCQKCLG
jgi:hypothetical protein